LGLGVPPGKKFARWHSQAKKGGEKVERFGVTKQLANALWQLQVY
jgi:hypothetical protein